MQCFDIDSGCRRFRFGYIAKKPGRPTELVFPVLDLVFLQVDLLRQFHQRLLTPDGGKRHLCLEIGVWFRRGRLVMVSPASGIQAKVRQKFHLSQLCSFPEPPLNSHDLDERTHHRHTPGPARDQSLKFQLEEKAQNSVNSPLMRSTGSVRRPTVSCFAPRKSSRLPE